MKEDLDVRPIIFWEGFPACGLLLKQVLDLFPQSIVVATHPAVPFNGLDRLLGVRIHWLNHPDDIWLQRKSFEDRNLIVHTGWNHKGWLRFDSYMKSRFDAKVVVVVDNRYKKNMRQFLGALYFRFYLRKFFDAAFVPGYEGMRLMKFLGMPRNQVFCGNYGASESVFISRTKIEDRENQFLFVGQLIERKGILFLINAFKNYRRKGGKWQLRIIGAGPLKSLCEGDGIVCDDFLQPLDVNEAMNRSKVFVLPSLDEHWGTVVCEAAACGNSLITTRYVGSSVDLVRHGINGFELNSLSEKLLEDLFFHYESLDNNSLQMASDISINISKAFNSSSYLLGFISIVRMCFAR